MNKLSGIVSGDTGRHLVIVAAGDKDLNQSICKKLTGSSYSAKAVYNGKSIISEIKKNPAALLLLDYKLPDMDAKAIFKQIEKLKLDVDFIIMTASHEEKKAAEMLRHGAREYLIKEPGFLDIIPALVEKAFREINIERQLAESQKDLPQEAQEYSFIFENAGTPMALLTDDGTFLLVNSALEKLCGYSRKQLEGKKSWRELAVKGTLRKLDVPEGAGTKASDVTLYNYEFQLESKPGSVKDIFLGINIIADDSRQIASFLDISLVQNIEDIFHKNDERFQNLIKNIPGIVYLCCYDEHWTMHYMVNEIERISGYPASDFINNNVRSYASIVHPDDVELVEEAVRKGVDAGKPYEMEYRLIKKNGEIAWVYEKGQKAYEKDDVIWLNGIIFDITEQKQLQLALDIATEEWRVTFDAIPNPVFLLNRECRIMKCNLAAAKFFDLSKDDIAGQLYYELFYDLDEPPEDGPYIKMLKSGETQSKIEQFDDRIVEITISPILDPDGNIYGSVLLMVDVTKLKNTEEELKEKNKQLKNIFHTAPVGIGVISKGKIVKANEHSASITGYSRKEMIGRDIRVFHENEAEFKRVAAHYEKLKKDEVATVATKLIRKDGKKIDTLLRFSPVDKKHSGYTCILTDLSAMRAIEVPSAKKKQE